MLLYYSYHQTLSWSIPKALSADIPLWQNSLGEIGAYGRKNHVPPEPHITPKKLLSHRSPFEELSNLKIGYVDGRPVTALMLFHTILALLGPKLPPTC
ncbi:uncharacterized protein VTP21DRAFT_10218 [Calcarisporiella thermophila]|uniref:uncharacterized protein n=1 Tax=Calcarisporiella thermophila TaxID=911321 RepID=UPI003743A7E7